MVDLTTTYMVLSAQLSFANPAGLEFFSLPDEGSAVCLKSVLSASS